MSERPYNSPKNRQKLCELMFEKYESPAIFISKDAVLSSYACGKTTGLVVDIGAGGTCITPGIDWLYTTDLSILITSPLSFYTPI